MKCPDCKGIHTELCFTCKNKGTVSVWKVICDPVRKVLAIMIMLPVVFVLMLFGVKFK